MIGCEGLARAAFASRATAFQLRFNSYYRELKKRNVRVSCAANVVSFVRSFTRQVG